MEIEENTEKDGNAIEGNKENQIAETHDSVVNIVSSAESIPSTTKKIKK